MGDQTSLNPRFAVSVEVEGREDGSLEVHVRSLAGQVHMNDGTAVVVVTMWEEGDGTVRARLRHTASGVTGYVQGNKTMLELSEALGLSFT